MIIDIVRHAETFSNAEGRLQGSEDLLLSKRGLEQAEQLVEFLDPFYDKIICSSMKRTRQTLALALGKSVEESLDLSEQEGQVLLSDHIKEMDLGKLEGKIKKDMSGEEREMMKSLQTDHNYTGHGGEAPIKFFHRVKQFFDEMRAVSELPEFRKILVITHQGVLKLIFNHILNIYAPLIRNADVIRFRMTPNSFEYLGMNLDEENKIFLELEHQLLSTS